ncbi:MAG: nucleotide exchange factor GrpE [Candidatus Babeliales bacterium]
MSDTSNHTPETPLTQEAHTNTTAVQEALELCKVESAEWKEKYARLAADYQNFQKRLEREYAAIKRNVQSSLLLDFLTVLDNVERALQVPDNSGSWRSGIELVRKEMLKVLQKHGVTPMEATSTFNPELHEAIMYTESADHASGTIVQVLEQGYMLNGIVLRPAKVSVAR